MLCKFKSVGINVSLPSDICCSASLCSLKHAKLMQEKCPSLKRVKLSSPVQIDVADEDAGLPDVGTRDARSY